MSSDKEHRRPLRLIAAVCNNWGIGKNGRLPWHLPTEFKFFVDTVTRVSRAGKINLLIWGKTCWYSNPESLFPMSNVVHVVLSKTLSAVPEYAHFLCRDFKAAVGQTSLPHIRDLVETIWVVGGHQVYKEGMEHPWCDLVYLTDVMADFNCDVFFPKLDRRIFIKQSRFPHVPNEIQEENGIKYKFQVFKRADL
ncbi:zgc:153031 [Osmerus eperlanus]|uniref:zgc:153031 n=1 Tax=Osmerus eperlanus TaxID=29151 RepID=UPI002E15CF5A